MGAYQFGTSVVVDETFYVESIPGDFSTAVPTDPTDVFFYVRAPDDTLSVYQFGVAGEVTNPSVGRYLLSLDASVVTPSGFWTYRVQGAGAVVAVAEGDFEILPSSVLEPVVSEPGFAPCQAWTDPEDIERECGLAIVGSDPTKYEAAAVAASQLLYQLSGKQFTGICRQTVRPFTDGCGCWPWLVWPASSGVPQMPVGFGWGGFGGYGWGWGYDGCSTLAGCGSLSRALLPGYPVTSIIDVQINGISLNDDQYRLDDNRWLTRMNDPTTGQAQFWPACQNISRPLGEPGTWGVECTTGQAPPMLGQLAAAELGCEIFKASVGEQCKLPQGTTNVIRQGISIEMAPFRAWGQMNGQWATGLYLVDAFLSAYNSQGLKRRSTITSPDDPPYAVRLGAGTGS